MKKYLALMLSLAMLAAMPSCGKIDGDSSSSKKVDKSSSSVDDADSTETSEDTETTQDDSEENTEASTSDATESTTDENKNDNKNESDKTTTTTSANGTGGSASGGSGTNKNKYKGDKDNNKNFDFSGKWEASEFFVDGYSNISHYLDINEYMNHVMQMELKKDGTGIGYDLDTEFELAWEATDNGIKITDKKNNTTIDLVKREDTLVIDIISASSDNKGFGSRLINSAKNYINDPVMVTPSDVESSEIVLEKVDEFEKKILLPEGVESPVELVSHKTENDEDGNKVLVLEYSWINVTQETDSFKNIIVDDVYQNGIQCDYFSVENVDKVLKPGESTNIKIGYYLTDDSAVYVIVDSNFTPLGYNYPFVEEEIDLGGKGGYKIPDKLEDSSLTIAEQRVEKSKDGKDIAVIIFDFYNGEDGIRSADLIYDVDVFHEDQESYEPLEETYSLSDKNLLKKYYSGLKVFPGVKTQVVCAAILEDKDKPFYVTLDEYSTGHHYVAPFTNEKNN